MTSEERVLEFFDVFPAELPELRKAFKCHLDQHAAEQRESCAVKANKAVHDGCGSNQLMHEVSEACLNATGESDDK